MITKPLSAVLLALAFIQVPGQDVKHTSTVLEGVGGPYSWGCPDTPIPPLVISPDRLLVTACNTLYMLNGRKEVIWKWTTKGAAFTDQPVIDSTGTIYAIACDLIWVALDSETGQLKWRQGANGRATYTQIKPYKDDQYLIVVNMGGYRDMSPSFHDEDTLFLCKGTQVIWEKDFPADATLQVWEKRILAVTYKDSRLVMEEISAD
jgi:outer membrane protein assembly factor BamB